MLVGLIFAVPILSIPNRSGPVFLSILAAEFLILAPVAAKVLYWLASRVTGRWILHAEEHDPPPFEVVRSFRIGW